MTLEELIDPKTDPAASPESLALYFHKQMKLRTSLNVTEIKHAGKLIKDYTGPGAKMIVDYAVQKLKQTTTKPWSFGIVLEFERPAAAIWFEKEREMERAKFKEILERIEALPAARRDDLKCMAEEAVRQGETGRAKQMMSWLGCSPIELEMANLFVQQGGLAETKNDGDREEKMSDQKSAEKKESRVVYSVIEVKGEDDFWLKIGRAFDNKDGSISVLLNAYPKNGKLIISKLETTLNKLPNSPKVQGVD